MQVLVLNNDGSYINVCSYRRAINLIAKGKVEVVEYTDKTIQNYSGSVKYQIPAVVRLIKFINGIYKSKVKFTKHNVLIRDNRTCSYCGTRNAKMTVDHILAISKGGKTNWDNTCCACLDCNSRKSNKTLSEVGMKLLIVPKVPSIGQFLNCKKTLISTEMRK